MLLRGPAAHRADRGRLRARPAEPGGRRHGQALRRQRLGDRADVRGRPHRRADAARALPGAVRGNRARGRRLGGDGLLQRGQRVDDDGKPAAARHPARRVGLRRAGHVGLDGHQVHRGGRPGRAGPGHAGTRRAVRPVGRRPARGGPGRARRRGPHRRQGAPHPAAGRSGRRARRRLPGFPGARGHSPRAAGYRRGQLRAGPQRAFAAPAGPVRAGWFRAGPGRPHRPERRDRAHPRRRERHRLPALHGLPARRAACGRARRGVRAGNPRAPEDRGGPRALAAAPRRVRPRRRRPVLLALRRGHRLGAARRRRVPVDERVRRDRRPRADRPAGDQLPDPGHRARHLPARRDRHRPVPPARGRGRCSSTRR